MAIAISLTSMNRPIRMRSAPLPKQCAKGLTMALASQYPSRLFNSAPLKLAFWNGCPSVVKII